MLIQWHPARTRPCAGGGGGAGGAGGAGPKSAIQPIQPMQPAMPGGGGGGEKQGSVIDSLGKPFGKAAMGQRGVKDQANALAALLRGRGQARS